MQKISGFAPFGSRVLVRVQNGPDAALYSDAAGTLLAINPITVDASGTWSAYVAEGIYAVTTSAPSGVQTAPQVLVVGDKAAPPVRVLAQQHTLVPTPADTAENTVFSTTLPALGPNDMVRVGGLVSQTNNANAATMRLRLGGVVAYAVALTASRVGVSFTTNIRNRGSVSSQLTGPMLFSQGGIQSGQDPTTISVNTGIPQTLTFSLQKVSGADAAALESIMVELLPGVG